MTFRTRLLLAMGAVALVPLAAIGFVVRREMATTLTTQDAARVASLVTLTRATLAGESAATADRLASLRDVIADDSRLRAALLQGTDRAYLLDYAARAMQLTGLSALEIQDDSGVVLSSGQFRNDYGRSDPRLLAELAAAGGAALLPVRSADAAFLVVARADSLSIGGRRLHLVGGTAVDLARLSAAAVDSDLTVRLALPTGATPVDSLAAASTGAVLTSGVAPGTAPTSSPGASSHPVPAVGRDIIVAEIPFPLIGADRTVRQARFIVAHRPTTLDALRARVDHWFLLAILLTAVAALLAAAVLAARVSLPLADLAAQTARVDLDALDFDFASTRQDEIGALTRLLATMTRRLRASASRLRDAERRATVGDVARQVTHDVKNGLTPIRHVLRHLTEVEHADPTQLASVFAERRPTLDASVAYLDALARQYARLTPRLDVRPSDVNAIARAVVDGRNGAPTNARLALALSDALAPIAADPLVLRRILENLVSNAVDAVHATGGTVTISTDALPDGGVRLVVADDGPGMTADELSRAGQDFYTTKPGGSGLGLSIVRRLATDLQAAMTMESAPGAGTRVTITFPGR